MRLQTSGTRGAYNVDTNLVHESELHDPVLESSQQAICSYNHSFENATFGGYHIEQ